MDCTKLEIQKIILYLINEKINNISLAIKIKIIKFNLYDKFIANLYKYITSNLFLFVNKKISSLDVNLIKKNFDVLFKKYLLIVSKGKINYEKNVS